MAGNYPDPPGQRLAYDKDGTVVYMTYRGWSNGLPAQFTEANTSVNETHMRNANDDDPNTKMNPSGVNAGYADHYFIFPSLRDITHMFIKGFGSAFQWSTNTTNGIDGTWTAVSGIADQSTNTKIAQRTNIYAFSSPLTGIKAIRFTCVSGGSSSYPGLSTFHLYGKPTADGDRLVWWHPTEDEPLRDTPALMDWGDNPRSSSTTKSFRLKNTSGGLTANSITIDSTDNPPAATPTVESQVQIRYNGGAYGSTASITSLAPGAISGTIDVKLDLASNAALSLWSHRLSAVAASWS